MSENYFETTRIEYRSRYEYKPLPRDATLVAALKKIPAAWTKAVCGALGLEASTRDPERKAAINHFLISPGTISQVWKSLPEPSRRIVSWLVNEKEGSAEVRELYDKFGIDDDISYFWNDGELPTTALGILRLHGLVFKGFADSEPGKVKIALVPADLRESLAAASQSPHTFEASPPMPEPACLKTIDVEEQLEIRPIRSKIQKGRFNNAYRFIVTLRDVYPTVWRRILVPENYSFWDLHVAIQDAMGWLDYHLHEFNMPDPHTGKNISIGMPDYNYFDDRKIIHDYFCYISDYFTMENHQAEYHYDFGDSWYHEIRLEAIIPRNQNTTYPICTDGECACPPEDCGGPPGYEDFLRTVQDPFDEDYIQTIIWAGGSFDPERFNPEDIHFDDPNLRWRAAFLEDEDAGEAISNSRPKKEPAEPFTYKNRLGDVYYLRFGRTKTGKMTLFFSKKADKRLLYTLPDGYEAGEHPDGRAYIRLKSEFFITDEEKKIVESAVKAAGTEDFVVEVFGGKITIFAGDIDEEMLPGMLGLPDLPDFKERFRELLEELGASLPEPKTFAEMMKDVQAYSPVLQFILEDKEQRTFTAERTRLCGEFLEWVRIGGPDRIDRITEKFCKHLGKDSFFDL